MYKYNGIQFDTQADLKAYIFFHHYFLCTDILYKSPKIEWKEDGVLMTYAPTLHITFNHLFFAVEVVTENPSEDTLLDLKEASKKLRIPVLIFLVTDKSFLVNILGTAAYQEQKYCVPLNEYPSVFIGANTVYQMAVDYTGDGSDVPLPKFRVGSTLQLHEVSNVQKTKMSAMPKTL